jgi:flavin-dependent dehydrogenase
VALLTSLGLAGGPLAAAPRLAGMLITGPRTSVTARYGGGLAGLAVTRTVLDDWLLGQAIAAGAKFEAGVNVRGANVDTSGDAATVRGVALITREGTNVRMPALLTIGADGRSSVVARSVRLARHPVRPRRWALGAYLSGVDGLSDLGEMHIRGGRYIGIAPVGGGLANVCVVADRAAVAGRAPDVFWTRLREEPDLGRRIDRAKQESPVVTTGPLAVSCDAPGMNGLLLAGDAAGFVDPMTGDGLHLAMRGALLAADEALVALERGTPAGSVARLAAARRRALDRKLRFNRALRQLVDMPAALDVASLGARVAPGLVRWAVRFAGDAA